MWTFGRKFGHELVCFLLSCSVLLLKAEEVISPSSINVIGDTMARALDIGSDKISQCGQSGCNQSQAIFENGGKLGPVDTAVPPASSMLRKSPRAIRERLILQPDLLEPSSISQNSPSEPENALLLNCEKLPSEPSQRCDWATACRNGESFIPYEYVYFCYLPKTAIGAPLLLAWAFYICYLAGNVADIYLASSMLHIVESLGMSDAVAGVTILAFANAAGDTFLGYWSCFSQEQSLDLYVGDVIGAACFVVLFVFGAVVVAAGPKGVHLNYREWIRDVSFLFLAAIGIVGYAVYPEWSRLFLLSASTRVREGNSWFYASLVLLYCVYVLVVYWQSRDGGRMPEESTCLEKISAPISCSGMEAGKPQIFVLRSFEDSVPATARPYCHSADVTTEGNPVDEEMFGRPIQKAATLLVPVACSSRASLAYTRIGKSALYGNKDIIIEDEHLRSPRGSRSSLPDDYRLASLHYRLSCTPRATSSMGSWKAAVAPRSSMRSRIKEIALLFIRFVSLVFLDSFEFLWKVSIPTPCYSAARLIAYPTGIGLYLLATGIFGFSLLTCASVLFTSLSITIIMTLFPSYLVYPWECNSVLRNLQCAGGVVMAALWNVTLIAELIQAVKCLGLIIGIAPQTIGLTVVAIGNSLADLFANVSIAKSGHPQMGLSSCYGAAIFSCLFGIGSTGTLSLLTKSKNAVDKFILDPPTFTFIRSLAILLPIVITSSAITSFTFKRVSASLLMLSYILTVGVAVFWCCGAD